MAIAAKIIEGKSTVAGPGPDNGRVKMPWDCNDGPEALRYAMHVRCHPRTEEAARKQVCHGRDQSGYSIA
jgi:hypothetical protein